MAGNISNDSSLIAALLAAPLAVSRAASGRPMGDSQPLMSLRPGEDEYPFQESPHIIQGVAFDEYSWQHRPSHTRGLLQRVEERERRERERSVSATQEHPSGAGFMAWYFVHASIYVSITLFLAFAYLTANIFGSVGLMPAGPDLTNTKWLVYGGLSILSGALASAIISFVLPFLLIGAWEAIAERSEMRRG